jgi:hypothetical protein
VFEELKRVRAVPKIPLRLSKTVTRYSLYRPYPACFEPAIRTPTNRYKLCWGQVPSKLICSFTHPCSRAHRSKSVVANSRRKRSNSSRRGRSAEIFGASAVMHRCCFLYSNPRWSGYFGLQRTDKKIELAKAAQKWVPQGTRMNDKKHRRLSAFMVWGFCARSRNSCRDCLSFCWQKH